MLISSVLGVKSPDGWLWQRITELALLIMAFLKTSLGCTIELLIVPTDTTSWSITRFVVFKKATTKASLSYISSRSEEHTSELQSRPHLVCRLLLEKKKKKLKNTQCIIIKRL